MSQVMTVRAGVARRLDAAFPVILWSYVAMTVAVLLLALVPAVLRTPVTAADRVPADAAEQIALMFAGTAELTEDVRSLIADYGLSLLNLSIAVLLFIRRPRDPVARLLAVAMVGTALAFNYQAHALFVAEADLFTRSTASDATLPLFPILNILHLGYHGLAGAAYVHAFLLFPNGRLTPGWLIWPVVIMYIGLVEEVVLGTLAFGFGAPVFPLLVVLLTVAFGTVVTPEGLPCTPESCPQGSLVQFDFSQVVTSDVTFFIIFFGFLIPVAGIYSLRARRALLTARELAQSQIVILALAFAFAIGIVALITSLVLIGVDLLPAQQAAQLRDLALKIFPPLYAVIPLAIVVAILRHKLFDIERLVNRAILYASLSLVLIGVYVASVVLLQAALRPFVAESEFAVAIATLVVVALFQPLRRRLQDVIDRRFYRHRYDARATVDTFSARVLREVDLEMVGADLCRVVHETVEPAHVSLWLRGAGR
jgi:hypothetical protein